MSVTQLFVYLGTYPSQPSYTRLDLQFNLIFVLGQQSCKVGRRVIDAISVDGRNVATSMKQWSQVTPTSVMIVGIQRLCEAEK